VRTKARRLRLTDLREHPIGLVRESLNALSLKVHAQLARRENRE
jgi:hypothetical protein